MAGDALRFAHASNLRIDVPLCVAGPLPDDARRAAEDAPAVAWTRIIEECVNRDVAFLLLTPRTIADAAIAHDARILLNGFRQLSEFEIPVYWSLAAGEALSGWLLDELPDNVTLLTGNENTATLARDGRVVATFNRSQTDDETKPVVRLPSGAAAELPLRIRIAADPGTIASFAECESDAPRPVATSPLTGDYVACWGDSSEQRRIVGGDLWIDPGSPCGRSADEPGAGGINIVEWSGGCLTRILRVPTATVRWQRCRVSVSAETSRAELIERLQLATLENEAAPDEQLTFIEWQVLGAGSEFDQLRDPSVRGELETIAVSAIESDGTTQRVHRWKLHPGETGLPNGMWQRLQEWLTMHADSEYGSTDRDAAVNLRPAVVREETERLLAEWLSATGN